MRNILVSPIRAVINEIPSSTAFYVLCSSYAWDNKAPNAIELHFLDTIERTNRFAFTADHASIILEFFLSIPEDADVFICCDSGESRSAAIAAALRKYQGESDNEMWNGEEYHPNTLVYKICCDIFGLNMPDKKLEKTFPPNRHKEE